MVGVEQEMIIAPQKTAWIPVTSNLNVTQTIPVNLDAGPDFCGKDVCVSGCDSKAECDPGFGSEWATKSKCPLNVCCSDFGFCGTTKDFCGNSTVKHPSCDKNKATLDRVVGYYEAWASRRPCNAFWPEQIPLGVYTHINFAFAAIDPETFEVRPDQTEDLDLLMRVTQLKTLDPDLKVMIALGGWTFNDPGPTQSTFSDIARSRTNQDKFFRSLNSFLSTHNLDGVDLDWEYPSADDRNGRAEDYKNFPDFIANLKSALAESGGRDEISITLPSSYWYLQHFDVAKLEPYVSFFNVMSYDLHGKWDLGNEWTGAYLDAHTNVTEIDKSLELLWRNNIDSSKVVLGLAFYARAYTLSDPNCVKPGCEFASGANKGKCSREVGILLNSEIDEIVAEKSLTPTFYKGADVQVLNWDDQWLSYDDEKTLRLKTEYACGSCLGGVMVWAISHDTKEGNKVSGLFKRKSVASDSDDDTYITKKDNHAQCNWTKCGEYCPAGWKMMTRDDEWRHSKGEIMLDDTACTSPHARRLCCPPSEIAPSCGWYSFKGGACYGECPSGYSEVGSNKRGCRSGYQAACCTTEDSNKKLLNSTRLFEACEWAESPYCQEGKCSFAGSAWPTEFTNSTTGSGAAICNIDPGRTKRDKNHYWNYKAGLRKYCCDTSNDDATWGTCTWRADIENIGTKGKRCMPNCKANEIKVAMEGGEECFGKGGGARSYCCTGVYTSSHKVLNPDLAGYDADLSGWVNNPVCEKSSGLDLYARSDQIPIGKTSHYLATLHVLAMILRGSLSGTDSTTVSGLKKLWDKYIPNHDDWENLTTDQILSWFGSDTNPTAAQTSPELWAQRILCNPAAYSAMFDKKKKSHPICDHFNIQPKDYYPADGSSGSVDDGTLTKRLAERRALFELEARGPAKTRSFACETGTKKRLIKYQSQPYPSVGDWPNDADQVETARDLEDYDHCHTSAMGTYNLGGDRLNYATEHIFEIESVGMFWQWAAQNANFANIDCNFVAEFFNKKVLDNPTDLPGLDASHQAIPMQRVMEQLGSEERTHNFVILHKSINLNKAQLWSHGRPRNDDSWADYVRDDLPKAIELIRDSVAVYNYMKTPDIWEKFKAINVDVRAEMELAQTQYKKTHGKDVALVECYDAWVEHQLSSFVSDGKTWVDGAIEKVETDWKPTESQEDDPLGHENFRALQEILDILKQDATEIDLSNFKLEDSDDSDDSMDDADGGGDGSIDTSDG
ncbi:glycoside hydrolase [Penicillium brevicompactum]|uniref:glycoside hydrolase n=1 Tax=Penicillium brevicompactum TaxID=5074 RepID=UPI002540CFCC|nr:glycoside hydrolase [Penicillium brevicompactum]KAJ5337537.1 glycoside hydrolase [Penicillium brevicompactum]